MYEVEEFPLLSIDLLTLELFKIVDGLYDVMLSLKIEWTGELVQIE